VREPVFFLDRFSAGLDDLTLKQQHSNEDVLRVLAKTGRFSIFEATEKQTNAGTLTRLVRDKFIETDTSCGYPWTLVALTDRGRAAIGKAGA
jgi:hypothetical protein